MKFINAARRKENLRQWKIWLSILVDERSKMENNAQRIKALQMINEAPYR